jgi:hypothetical protein
MNRLGNYLTSPTLSDAVGDKIISQLEAEVVMERVCYERSIGFISHELEISQERVITIHSETLIKLRNWLKT